VWANVPTGGGGQPAITVENTLGSTSAANALSAAMGNRLYNEKQEKITGAASSIASSNLIANRILISDTNGKVSTSEVKVSDLNGKVGVYFSITAPTINQGSYLWFNTENMMMYVWYSNYWQVVRGAAAP
jgi:tRNA(His) 5'-end guanylyltransferase